MAAFSIVTWDTTNNRNKRQASNSNTWDFQSVRIGTDTLTISEATSTAFNFNANEIQNILTPTAATSAATKGYVDAVATGLVVKSSVIAATTVALSANTYSNGTSGVGATLTGNANGALDTIDTTYTSPTIGDRLLIKNESTATHNGIYTVTQVGDGSHPYILTRATDADTCQPATNPKVTSGMHMFVETGSTNAGQGWVLVTPDPITLGTTSLSFSQFSALASYTAGNGISITSGTIAARIDGNSLQFSSGVITLTLNGSTLTQGGSGLSVANNGITATQLATSVAGNGLTGGGGSALAVEAADSSIVVSSSGIQLAAYDALVNDNAGTVSAGQIVYVKANGHVDLASWTVTSNAFGLGVVKSSTITATASGNVTTQAGVEIAGFTGLTPGAPCYLGATAGAIVQTLSGIAATNYVYIVGEAISATTIRFNPQFVMEY